MRLEPGGRGAPHATTLLAVDGARSRRRSSRRARSFTSTKTSRAAAPDDQVELVARRRGRWPRGSGSRGAGSAAPRSARRGSRRATSRTRAPGTSGGAAGTGRAPDHGARVLRRDVADVRREAVPRVERVEPAHRAGRASPSRRSRPRRSRRSSCRRRRRRCAAGRAAPAGSRRRGTPPRADGARPRTVRSPQRFERWSPRRSMSVDGDHAHGDPRWRPRGLRGRAARAPRARPASSRSAAPAAGRGGREACRSRAGRPRRRAARRATRDPASSAPATNRAPAAGRSGAVAGRWRAAPSEDSPPPRTGPCRLRVDVRARPAARSRRPRTRVGSARGHRIAVGVRARRGTSRSRPSTRRAAQMTTSSAARRTTGAGSACSGRRLCRRRVRREVRLDRLACEPLRVVLRRRNRERGARDQPRTTAPSARTSAQRPDATSMARVRERGPSRRYDCRSSRTRAFLPTRPRR